MKVTACVEARGAAPGEGWLSIDGYRYAWRQYAGTPGVVPVFFLNGAFQTMDSWARFVERLRQTRPVIVCDLPGTGRSDDLPCEEGLDLFARAVEQVLDSLEVPRSHFIAASYGAPIAYRFAQLHPDRVGGMTLAGVARALPRSVLDGTARTVDLLHAGRVDEFAMQVVDLLVCRDPGRPTARREVVRRLLMSSLTRMDDRQQRQFITATTRLLAHPPLDLASPPDAPVLVLTGEHDIYTGVEHGREVADALPNGSFAMVPAAGHLFHLEQPGVVEEIFDRFLAASDAHVDPHSPPEDRVPLAAAVTAQPSLHSSR